MNLIEALCPEAREELTRHGIIELISVTVHAVPDPERPDDRLAMKITAEVCDNFGTSIPAIDNRLNRADEICSTAGEDLSLPFRDELLVTLGIRCRELAGLREGKIDGQPVAYLSDPEIAKLIGPTLENPDINALVWCMEWCVTKEEDGRLLAYCDDPLIAEEVDEDSWYLIRDRMRRVNYVIGGLVAEMMGEGQRLF
jgi:hypothetical protein